MPPRALRLTLTLAHPTHTAVVGFPLMRFLSRDTVLVRRRNAGNEGTLGELPSGLMLGYPEHVFVLMVEGEVLAAEPRANRHIECARRLCGP